MLIYIVGLDEDYGEPESLAQTWVPTFSTRLRKAETKPKNIKFIL